MGWYHVNCSLPYEERCSTAWVDRCLCSVRWDRISRTVFDNLPSPRASIGWSPEPLPTSLWWTEHVGGCDACWRWLSGDNCNARKNQHFQTLIFVFFASPSLGMYSAKTVPRTTATLSDQQAVEMSDDAPQQSLVSRSSHIPWVRPNS